MSYNDMGFSINMTGATFMLLAQNQIQEATVGERWLFGTVWVVRRRQCELLLQLHNESSVPKVRKNEHFGRLRNECANGAMKLKIAVRNAPIRTVAARSILSAMFHDVHHVYGRLNRRWLEPLLSSVRHSPPEVFGSKDVLVIREKNWEFIYSSPPKPA